MRELLELTVSLFDFPVIETPETVQAERLHVQRGHDASENDGLPHAVLGKVHRTRQEPHKTAREGVAGSRRVEHRFKRVGRRAEDTVPVEHERPVAALLDDDGLRAHGLYAPCRPDEARLAGKLAYLGLV